MEEIVNRIENGNWDDALKAFLEYSKVNTIDSRVCIIGATIMEHYGESDTMFSFIMDGLKKDPFNYELYILLGNYYSLTNPDQAYLSYENALYYCERSGNTNDLEAIRSIFDEYCSNNPISVKNVTFAILSYNTLEYTKNCIESIRQTCNSNSYELVVVDNASTDGSVDWLRNQKDIILIENKSNAGFPAGCNQCIRIANPENDIFLLNNDTLMLSNSLFWLRIGLYKDNRTGAVGAVTNCSGNGQQLEDRFDSIDDYIRYGLSLNVPSSNPYELKTFLIMFAMLIKRDAINKTGFLDERFTPGNFEDNDYGMRLMNNGYDCVLCHNSYIYHYGSKSFSGDVEGYINLYITNRNKFKDKWGFYGDYYAHARNEVIDLIEAEKNDRISVLEIGCGLGGTLARIKYEFPNSDVHGIEIEKDVASIGNKRLDIRCGDIETFSLGNEEYDYILFPDVLEHLRDPEAVLTTLKRNLKDKGFIIASIPNLMNAAVIRKLLAGDFTYQDAGILDKTHLRFFTMNEIERMFLRTGYETKYIGSVVMPEESTAKHGNFFDKLLSIDGVAKRELFDTYQFIVKAQNHT